jgi:hypothetical protein
MSDEDRDCLEKFRDIRRALVSDLGAELGEGHQADYNSVHGADEIGTHEMLISEVSNANNILRY